METVANVTVASSVLYNVTDNPCVYNFTDRTPTNLQVMGIFTTSVILQWAIICDQTNSSPLSPHTFEIHVDPITSKFIKDKDLVSFIVTRISGDTRQYRLMSLLPETVYTLYITSINQDGNKDQSESITFRTHPAEVHPYIHTQVGAVEAVLVFAILAAWALTIGWFVKKWATLRILHPSEYCYTKTPPKNLDSVKVVNTEDDSIIFGNHGRDYHRTMKARQKRLDRMQTMPNLNILQTTDFKLPPSKSKMDGCSKLTKSRTMGDINIKSRMDTMPSTIYGHKEFANLNTMDNLNSCPEESPKSERNYSTVV